LNPNKFFAIRENNRRLATWLRSMVNVQWCAMEDGDRDELQTQISKLADDYERTEGKCFTKQMALCFNLYLLIFVQ
jgi:hypothetical protein